MKKLNFIIQLTACLLVLAVPSASNAWHYDRGSFVTAMKPCLPGSANTATAEGIPACSPPVPLSNCVAAPSSARRLSYMGIADYIIRPSGRILTQRLGHSLDMDERLRVGHIESCSGDKLSEALTVPMMLRMTLDDPSCAGQRCTLPDFTVDLPLPCSGSSCRARYSSSQALFTAAGLPRVPSTFPWTAEMIALAVVDPAGQAILTPGIRLGGKVKRLGFPRGAARWDGRLVRVYEPCPASATDTTTADGVAACSSSRPVSNCESDPAGAVDAERLAKGKLKLKAKSKGELSLKGFFEGLKSCSGQPYTGTLQLAVSMRVTVEDPACTGGFCTAVDIEATTPISVSDGGGLFRGYVLSGVPIGNGTFANIEIIRAEIRDGAGRAVLAGHGMLVRCDQRPDGPFCFGN